MAPPVVTLSASGLHVPSADLHIDPWGPSERAIITHGHADHARGTARHVLTAESGVGILQVRLGAGASIQGVAFGERIRVGDATISLHPAGHILGSAQVRIESGGEVWVVTGDCKRQPDPAAEAFEVVECHTLISECTFGLPVYRWPDPETVMEEVMAWWEESAAEGRNVLLGAYALGKAQRVLAHLARIGDRAGPGGGFPGPILVHGAVERLLPPYLAEGIRLPAVSKATPEAVKAAAGRALVVAPPSAAGTPWARKLDPLSLGVASGWMKLRGTRRRRGADRGFVLSDHLDWPDLLATVSETGAERVGLTHGTTGPAVRYLQEQGLDAWSLPTRFEGEAEDADEADRAEASGADPAAADGSAP
jgi:putative mRNA 3-end processing factor